MAKTQKLEVPKPSDGGSVKFSELSDADFRRLVNNQTNNELLVWGMKHKIFRSQLSVNRKRQLEAFLPKWTWTFTAADSKMWALLPTQYQDILRSPNGMLTADAIAKATGRVSMGDYYKRFPFVVVVSE